MQDFEPAASLVQTRAPVQEGKRCRALLRRMLRDQKGIDGAAAANALISYFGSLRATLNAKPEEQLRAVGDPRVVRYLGIVRQSMRWVLRDAIEEKTFIAAPDGLRQYLRFSYGGQSFEHLRIFYLNAAGGLLREHCFERGSPDETVAYVGQIVGRGLELGARNLVMAHNHPSGDPQPSKSDREVTRKIAIAAHVVGMTLYDHLIVAEGSDFSFRENGFL